MFLSEESMPNVEQLAFLVTLCHQEYRQQDDRGMTEFNFDEWLPFIGQMALKICNVQTYERR